MPYVCNGLSGGGVQVGDALPQFCPVEVLRPDEGEEHRYDEGDEQTEAACKECQTLSALAELPK
jgi:hypothetical protein